MMIAAARWHLGDVMMHIMIFALFDVCVCVSPLTWHVCINYRFFTFIIIIHDNYSVSSTYNATQYSNNQAVSVEHQILYGKVTYTRKPS